MALIDVIEARDIDQLKQVLLGVLDRVKEIISELRNETEVEVKITFRKKGEPK